MSDIILNITQTEANKLITAHDGDVALLCLFRKLNPGASDEQAADALCRTMGEIRAAGEKLSRMLTSSPTANDTAETPKKPEVPEYTEDKIPQYSRTEVTGRGSGDPVFKVLVDEAQRVTGRIISENFMRILFGIYDHLGLPADVIMLLMNFCAEKNSLKNGGNGKLTASLLEREAYYWYNNGIMTHELAEEHINRSSQKWTAVGKVKEVLGIHGRNLTTTESGFVDSWLEMGFGTDAIAIAYDRTVTNTGSLKWKYLNTILNSWHGKNLHTAAEINAAEPQKKASAAKNTGEKAKNDVDLDKLKSIYDRI